MADYIEREAALHELCKPCNALPEDEVCPYRFTGCRQYAAIFTLPVADVVEVRHGKDVYRQNNEHHCEFMCSLCGGWIGVIEGGDCDFNFCPNCGAKIGGADDGKNT